MTTSRPVRFAVIGLAAAGLITSCGAEQQHSSESAETVPPRATAIADSDWGYDVGNKYMVAGAADTIIVGTVLSEVVPSGTRQDPVPETQFVVRVDESLKGDATGEITVSQLGGFIPEQNTVVLSGEDPLLEPGSSYVITLGYDPATDWYTATPATNGIAEVASTESNGPQRRGEGAEPEAVTTMRDAIANQEEPQPDE